MMAFVEHVACWGVGIVEAAHGRLRHDQGVVGNNNAGATGAAHAAFDEAFLIMRAGSIDAFTAPVRQAKRVARPD